MSNAHKILVADDSLTIRKLVESVLSQDGYQVITAASGAECLTKASTEKPNLILLDYLLPDMQGTEVCRSLINSPETWEIPVLMMSSNGNAIRQLYQDLNNVADYLTKPFAPSVLKAVVGHLLQTEKAAESGESSAGAANAQPAPATPVREKSLPTEFIQKVTRLLNLMENPAPGAPVAKSAVADSGKEGLASPAKRSKPRRSRKTVASAPTSDAVLRKFRLALQKHLRPRAHQVPEWEMARGTEDPGSYFLARLLTKDVLWELAADLLRATGAPADAPGALRCSATFAPLDAILEHLHAERATGELRVDTGEEIVLACFEKGEVLLLTTNHPRNYCSGAACDFQALPDATISEAVSTQEEKWVPFFISLDSGGHLPPDSSLPELLAAQGEKCLVRAFQSRNAVVSFSPLTKLPATVRAHRLDRSLSQLRLACYRTVDDWFTLERAFPDMDLPLVCSPEIEDRLRDLRLDAAEQGALEAVWNGGTVTEIAEALGLKPFEACRLLFRFLKLGLVHLGASRIQGGRPENGLPSTAAPEQPSHPKQAIDATASTPSSATPPPDAGGLPEHTETPELNHLKDLPPMPISSPPLTNFNPVLSGPIGGGAESQPGDGANATEQFTSNPNP